MIWFASKPRISCCPGNLGFCFENWKSDWLNHSPIDALTAIQVGARSRTCAERIKWRYRPNPTWVAETASRSPCRVRDAEPIDQE